MSTFGWFWLQSMMVITKKNHTEDFLYIDCIKEPSQLFCLCYFWSN